MTALDRYSDGLYNFFQYLVRLFGLPQRRRVKIVHHDAMSEDWNDQRLDIFWSAERAAFEEGHRLCGAVESLRPAWGNAEREEL